MKTFQDIIVSEVQRRGWSGYRLAKEAGLPMRAVQNYLAGRVDILAERLQVLCRVLGLELRQAKQSHTPPAVNAKGRGRVSGRGKPKNRKARR